MSRRGPDWSPMGQIPLADTGANMKLVCSLRWPQSTQIHILPHLFFPPSFSSLGCVAAPWYNKGITGRVKYSLDPASWILSCTSWLGELMCLFWCVWLSFCFQLVCCSFVVLWNHVLTSSEGQFFQRFESAFSYVNIPELNQHLKCVYLVMSCS